MPTETEEIVDVVMAAAPAEPLPTWEQMRRAVMHIAKDKSEWAGIPLPLPDLELHIEPKYPYRMDTVKPDEPEPTGKKYKVINRWFSSKLRVNVVLLRDDDGHTFHDYELHNPADFIINTIGATTAWSIEAEMKAMAKLAALVEPHTFKYYMLTGTFIERSKRSGVFYIFRKLRPTLAMAADRRGGMKMLCCLCSHTIGYYRNSWAGVLCPTDDVIAHLVYMRGDEPKFWKMCNQHHPAEPASGL